MRDTTLQQPMNMFQDILEYIETCSTVQPSEQFSEALWREEVDVLFACIEDVCPFPCLQQIHTIKEDSLPLITSFYKAAKNRSEQKHSHKRHRRELQVEELLGATQIEQRTPEWYKQGYELLTASQCGDVRAGGRTRAKLVLSKATPPLPQKRRLAAWSQETNPFDWGIRFEPVAKMVYEHITHTTVKDIGRLVHKKEDLKLAASPDGIVIACETNQRVGRLVEFKAPISRKIDETTIPEQYWMQMQIQMEVADVDTCDYFEIVLRSKHTSDTVTEGPALYSGTLLLLGDADMQPTRYIYSAIHSPIGDVRLAEGEQILETLTWDLLGFHLSTVHRSRAWFATFVPDIETFWRDVALARSGQFELPASKRPKKFNICMIQDDMEPVTRATTGLRIYTEDEIMIEG